MVHNDNNIVYNIVLLHCYNVRFCFVIVTISNCGVCIVHCHCSLLIAIVYVQCCNNIVGGLVLRWVGHTAGCELTGFFPRIDRIFPSST